MGTIPMDLLIVQCLRHVRIAKDFFKSPTQYLGGNQGAAMTRNGGQRTNGLTRK